MVNAILKLLRSFLRQDNDRVGHLYYLYGIKPIKPCKYVIDECTVTK
jgi:hypothetical protein